MTLAVVSPTALYPAAYISSPRLTLRTWKQNIRSSLSLSLADDQRQPSGSGPQTQSCSPACRCSLTVMPGPQPQPELDPNLTRAGPQTWNESHRACGVAGSVL
eukprot:1344515-Rhodomonas_salina.2